MGRGVKLWHYTARHHLEGGTAHGGPGILNVGILGNGHPLVKLPSLVWLTDDGRWTQEWATMVGTDCDRSETRVEVVIPKAHRGSIHRWTTVGPLVTPPDFLADLNAYGLPESWWIYSGNIPRAWLRRVEHRPLLAAA